MHSKDFNKIKKWYDLGYYTEAMLQQFVNKGKITQEEMDEIING